MAMRRLVWAHRYDALLPNPRDRFHLSPGLRLRITANWRRSQCKDHDFFTRKRADVVV